MKWNWKTILGVVFSVGGIVLAPENVAVLSEAVSVIATVGGLIVAAASGKAVEKKAD